MRTSIVLACEPGVVPLGVSGDLERNFKFLSKLGYDGVELFVLNPTSLRPDWINRRRKEHGLDISAIGTGLVYTRLGLSFSSPDAEVRKKALEKFREYVKLASKLQAPVIVGSIRGSCEKKHEGLEHLRQCLIECDSMAEENSVEILLEPMNRYETNLINTIEQAMEFIRQMKHFKVLADTFHMNIEEASLGTAILQAGERLGHLHIADSNRLPPGKGHLNFREVFSSLETIKFGGFLSAEILPLPDAQTAAIETIKFLKG